MARPDREEGPRSLWGTGCYESSAEAAEGNQAELTV